jgi:hypothetical protein
MARPFSIDYSELHEYKKKSHSSMPRAQDRRRNLIICSK